MEAYENAPEGEGKVLYNLYGGNLSKNVRAAVVRSGVEVYAKPLHTLRKSCITDWAGSYPMHVVKEWAGHADIATTLRYSHLSPQHKSEAVERLVEQQAGNVVEFPSAKTKKR